MSVGLTLVACGALLIGLVVTGPHTTPITDAIAAGLGSVFVFVGAILLAFDYRGKG